MVEKNKNIQLDIRKDLNHLIIGFGKGRLFKESLDRFDFPGNEAFDEFYNGRLPIYEDQDARLTLVAVRHSDIAWMLKKGWIDVGVGSSLWFINERNLALKKGFGLETKNYRLSVIAKPHMRIENVSSVATRFVNIAERFFNEKNLFPDIIKMDGCHEIALSLGQTDAIIDVIETGRTIRKMNLIELDQINQLGHEVWLRNNEFYDKIRARVEDLLLPAYGNSVALATL